MSRYGNYIPSWIMAPFVNKRIRKQVVHEASNRLYRDIQSELSSMRYLDEVLLDIVKLSPCIPCSEEGFNHSRPSTRYLENLLNGLKDGTIEIIVKETTN